MTDDFFNRPSEQSRVKAAIVSKYFDAWSKVIVRNVSSRLAYFDLFAGCGRYRDGTESTPLLVLRKAISSRIIHPGLLLFFNESNPAYATDLDRELRSVKGYELLASNIQITREEVGEATVGLVDRWQGVPTLFFIDPWGYKGLSLRLIEATLRNKGSECIFFFNYNRINPALNNLLVKEPMEELFGEARVSALNTKLTGLSPHLREARILEELCSALKESGARFVLTFPFTDEHGTRTSHYLIFATKHRKGHDIMKTILDRASSEHDQGVPSLGFSTAATGQGFLFSLNAPLEDLKAALLNEFAGQSLTMGVVFARHNVGRKFTQKNYKTALAELEAEGAIHADPPSNERPRGTFANHVLIRFPKRSTSAGRRPNER
jgi:three-Cys-motif partner protein